MTVDLAAPPAAPALSARTGLAELDQVVFEQDDWWSRSAADQAELRLRLVGHSVRHHLERNPAYRRFAESTGFDPDDLGGPADLSRVPQLPTTLFKRTELRTPTAEHCSLFVSSGTSSANRSRVWRDDTTLQRLVGSLRPDGEIWGSLYDGVDLDEDGLTLHLGPSRADGAGVWISYVMTMIELFTTTHHYLADGVLRVTDIARDLRTAVAGGGFTAVAGPPVFIGELLRHLAERGEKLDAGERLVVITGGGWKKDRATRMEPAQLRELAVSTLGLRSSKQVRDVFNQVELNTAFVECEHHRKHVPPWVEVVVRDPASLAPVATGDTGLLSYLDPSAVSYPCYLLSEDFGATEVDACPCGRRGTTVSVTRRVDTATHHGCALRLSTSTRIG